MYSLTEIRKIIKTIEHGVKITHLQLVNGVYLYNTPTENDRMVSESWINKQEDNLFKSAGVKRKTL